MVYVCQTLRKSPNNWMKDTLGRELTAVTAPFHCQTLWGQIFFSSDGPLGGAATVLPLCLPTALCWQVTVDQVGIGVHFLKFDFGFFLHRRTCCKDCTLLRRSLWIWSGIILVPSWMMLAFPTIGNAFLTGRNNLTTTLIPGRQECIPNRRECRQECRLEWKAMVGIKVTSSLVYIFVLMKLFWEKAT